MDQSCFEQISKEANTLRTSTAFAHPTNGAMDYTQISTARQRTNSLGKFHTARRRSIYHKSLMVFLVCAWFQPCVGGSLTGKVVACTNEGAEVAVPLVDTYQCFKCFCKRGQVECVQPRCPSLDGCHAVLFSRPEGHCCDVCKGCLVNGVQMPHGANWPDEDNPCLVRMCNAGVVTVTEELCRPPCKHPVQLPGQCCPSCSGCNFNGQNYMSGEVFTLRDEPDVECKCMVGSVSCSSRACPVLNCPVRSRHKLPGHRCHSCKGRRTIFDTPGSCYLSQTVYSHGDRHSPDKCTSCECQHGTMVCQREHCPSLNCSPSDQVLPPGACCPVCQNQEACEAEGREIKHGEVWERDDCQACTCLNGAWQCSQVVCPASSCPQGYISITEDSLCCPKCVKEYATCTVRGRSSNSLQTFSGLNYRTQGYCLHELVRDCGRGDFSIKVKYDKRGGGLMDPTQRQDRSKTLTLYQLHLVSIRLGPTSIKLFRNGKLRMNRKDKIREAGTGRDLVKEKVVNGEGEDFLKKLALSFRNGKISIRLESLGVILSWDIVRGTLKVKVDAQRYFGDRRLCGLCGSVGGDRARLTRNKRFEPVLPSHMAWVWRRGHACRERNEDAREEMERQATTEDSGLGAEITSFLNMVESSSSHSEKFPPPPENYYRTDEILA